MERLRFPHCPIAAMRGSLSLMRSGELDYVDEVVVLQKGLASKGNEYKLVYAHRFLGFINKRGELTTDGYLLQEQSRYTPTLQNAIIRGYGYPLVGLVIDVKGSLDTAQNFFIKADMRLQTAIKTARLFGYLFEEAKMLEQPPRRKLSSEAIAQALVEDQTISPEQIAAIIDRARQIDNILNQL